MPNPSLNRTRYGPVSSNVKRQEIRTAATRRIAAYNCQAVTGHVVAKSRRAETGQLRTVVCDVQFVNYSCQYRHLRKFVVRWHSKTDLRD